MHFFVRFTPRPGKESEFRAEMFRVIEVTKTETDCLAIHGHACLICGADLGAIYGELGEGFIHVHHIRPLSGTRQERETDPEKDLIPVCPNCHAVVHRGGVTRSPDEIRSALRGRRNGAASRGHSVKPKTNRRSASAGRGSRRLR